MRAVMTQSMRCSHSHIHACLRAETWQRIDHDCCAQRQTKDRLPRHSVKVICDVSTLHSKVAEGARVVLNLHQHGPGDLGADVQI